MEPKIGIGHNHPPADKALPIHVDAKDLEAAKAAATQLPPNFSLNAAKRAVEQHIVKHKEARRSVRVELREAMQAISGSMLRPPSTRSRRKGSSRRAFVPT